MHLKDLNTQKSLLARNQMLTAQKVTPLPTHVDLMRFLSSCLQQMSHSVREPHSEGVSGLVEVRFLVPQDLVGLAIGREGVNVNAARRIPGIVSIEYNDYNSMFEIKGEVRILRDY